MTVEALKVKLSFHVGTNPSAQVLQLLDDNGELFGFFYLMNVDVFGFNGFIS